MLAFSADAIYLQKCYAVHGCWGWDNVLHPPPLRIDALNPKTSTLNVKTPNPKPQTNKLEALNGKTRKDDIGEGKEQRSLSH